MNPFALDDVTSVVSTALHVDALVREAAPAFRCRAFHLGFITYRVSLQFPAVRCEKLGVTSRGLGCDACRRRSRVPLGSHGHLPSVLSPPVPE